MFGVLPDLTKTFILSKITQEQIFEYYLGIPVETGLLIKVPNILRIDNNPTGSFYYSNNGKLRFRDLGGGFWGDCFDLVAYLGQINVNSKKGFMLILERIAKDFRLHKYDGNHDTILRFQPVDTTIKVRVKKIINITTRQFTTKDADFWMQGNIKKKGLDKYYCRACENIWIDGELKYTFNSFDPAYAYYFGKDNEGIDNLRIYFPFRKEYRFLSNCSPLQGYKQLTPDYIGLITKSYKDVMSLDSFNISSVAPSSESIMLSKDDWFKLKYTCSHWFSLMDYDTAGILMAKKLRDNYNIQPLFFSQTFKDQNKYRIESTRKFPKLYNNYKNYGVKDFFEFVQKVGKDKVIETIIQSKEIFEEGLQNIDNDINNNLKFLKYAK
jgi:hypothetical protein